MARVIAVAVPKGGTGKTTTTVNLGAALAEQGQRVLLVDFDPQGNLTQSLGLRPDEVEQTTYTAIKHFLETYEPALDRVIVSTPIGGVDLAPTNEFLNIANDELAMAMKREEVLKNLIEPLHARYDYILIDTLPYLGVLVINALVAAQEVLIPLQAEYLPTTSIKLILKQLQVIRQRKLNPTLAINGILLTMVDPRTVITRQTVDYVRKAFGAHVRVFDTMIKRSVSFPTSQGNHQSILQFEPRGEGAVAYRALAQEVLRGTV